MGEEGVGGYSEEMRVESSEFCKEGRMGGGGVVKEGMYKGCLLIGVLEG